MRLRSATREALQRRGGGGGGGQGWREERGQWGGGSEGRGGVRGKVTGEEGTSGLWRCVALRDDTHPSPGTHLLASSGPSASAMAVRRSGMTPSILAMCLAVVSQLALVPQNRRTECWS